jgi:uncharacterized protein (DUF4415 family)
MKKEYELKKLQMEPYPYLKKLKKRVTIRLDADVIECFKNSGIATHTRHQTLVNDFLRSCKGYEDDSKDDLEKGGMR